MNRKNNNKKRNIDYIPQGDETALNTKVEELGLHPKTKELFLKNNVLTVYDIAKYNSKQLFKIQGFGKKDLIGVERELGKLNISLAPLVEVEEEKVESDKLKQDKPIKQVKNAKIEKTVQKNKQEKSEKKADKSTKEDVSIADMGLNSKTYNVLKRGNVLTLFQIAEKTERDLFKVRGMNKQSVEELKLKLKEFGLLLATKEIKNELKKEQPKEQPKEKKKEKQKDLEYKRISKGEKFGIGKGNEVIIPAMYDEVFMVKEEMVCVDVDGLFGYVNLNNKMVIEPKYELAQSFSMGLANVMLNDKYGYIDKTGKVVLDFKYELATPFEEDGTARVKLDGRWASITKEGTITWI